MNDWISDVHGNIYVCVASNWTVWSFFLKNEISNFPSFMWNEILNGRLHSDRHDDFAANFWRISDKHRLIAQSPSFVCVNRFLMLNVKCQIYRNRRIIKKPLINSHVMSRGLTKHHSDVFSLEIFKVFPLFGRSPWLLHLFSSLSATLEKSHNIAS